MIERTALAQLISEMSLIVAVSNVYLAGRYQEIRDVLEQSTSIGNDGLKELRGKADASLVTGCIPALVVNLGALYVFLQPFASGELPLASICLWGCDAFVSAYLLLLVVFLLLVTWSGYLTIATVLKRREVTKNITAG